jgi:hypothetical protein
MVVLRPTMRLRAALPVSRVVGVSDTALGDWYVNRLTVDRQPLLLLLSATSLLPILVRAVQVRDLPMRLRDLVAMRLARLGVSRPLIESERRAMAPVQIGATVDRSVLGIMVDFAKSVPCYLAAGWNDVDLEVVAERLAQTPCHAGQPSKLVIFPDKKAPELLAAKWSG